MLLLAVVVAEVGMHATYSGPSSLAGSGAGIVTCTAIPDALAER